MSIPGHRGAEKGTLPESQGARMGKRERHERIQAELRAAPSIRVAELAAELDVSTETIRRDLEELEQRGLINRTYGGAVRPLGLEPAVSERHRMMTAEREGIAALAVKVIRQNEVVAIGAGATTVHVARRIAAECRDITVITHAFGVATVVASNPTITILMCPGRYNGREGSVLGPETVDFIQSYNANHAILGASGMTAEGPNEADAAAAAVHRAFMGRAASTMVVADHTKFDVPALARWGRWNEIDRLVTSAQPQGALARALERARVEVLVAAKPITAR